ncbi:MbnP family protein [Aureispira anguillae]|uniref:T9SS type A sorting domain-containing protein n=1 Tax=Aureispira anguillae TaxID=2864201 RepID=A0A915YHK0_9BACT|nr:MbnP family protein [Aureispira anguillae]BDS13303.1 T9SS type A sorting domain-containing protein [Aureispira anguillae]
MVKCLCLLFLLCCSNWSISAQTNVTLNIQHKFEKSTYVPGQPYIDGNNKVIIINRIQYYLSNIELVYDGHQSVVLNDQYILLDGETSTYNLGAIPTTIQELERLNMDLGVDPNANLNTPSSYPSEHPLSTTDMYSNDQQSYIFLMVEGMIDTDGDQIPDKAFNFHATGDQLLRTITIDAMTPANDNCLKINLTANIANWLKEIDLESINTQENGNAENQQLCDNTLDHKVFYNVSTTDVTTLVSPRNHIHIDSRLAIAPTIHYKFYTLEQLDMTITNVNGTYFIQRFDLEPQGDFYMSENLASGIYIVIFTTPKGIRQCKRFVIQN